MTMAITSASFIALICALVVLSILPPVRRRLKQRSLRIVPGPISPSFWTGNNVIPNTIIHALLTLSAGIAKELHSPFDMRFREHVLTSYGRAVRIAMPLGVRTSARRTKCDSQIDVWTVVGCGDRSLRPGRSRDDVREAPRGVRITRMVLRVGI